MNIQPIGSTITPRLDDRPVGGAEPQAGMTKSAGTDAASAASATSATSATATAKASPSRDDVDTAVKKLNDSMPGSSQSLQFSVDHDSKEIVVKLIDQDTKEVLRQMPSEEALQMAKSIDKLQGRLIDHKV
jgi:flagellar protein FlaG